METKPRHTGIHWERPMDCGLTLGQVVSSSLRDWCGGHDPTGKWVVLSPRSHPKLVNRVTGEMGDWHDGGSYHDTKEEAEVTATRGVLGQQ